MKRVIQAGVFKAECLKIMDEVCKSKHEVVVTKHKIPIVKIAPLEEKEERLFGKMKGTGRALGNIIESTGEIWDAAS